MTELIIDDSRQWQIYRIYIIIPNTFYCHNVKQNGNKAIENAPVLNIDTLLLANSVALSAFTNEAVGPFHISSMHSHEIGDNGHCVYDWRS